MRVKPCASVASVVVACSLALFSVPPAAAQDVRSGVEQLASQITKEAPEGRQLRIAVADFPDLQGVTSDLGRYIASRLTTRLAQSPKFFVIERQRLGQVLAELKFSMSDLVDPNKAKQLGKMAGVEAIIVGTVADVGNQFDFDARMIDIETNRLLLGATVAIAKDPAVDDMNKRGRQEASQERRSGGGSVSTPSSTPSPGGLRFDGRLMSLTVLDAEVMGSDVKITLLYLNKGDAPHRGRWWYSGIDYNYLVDNLGNRYGWTGDSFSGGRKFAPQQPESIWITFGKMHPAATSISLNMSWSVDPDTGPSAQGNVVIRGIPLRR
jgi:TolB-like protein